MKHNDYVYVIHDPYENPRRTQLSHVILPTTINKYKGDTLAYIPGKGHRRIEINSMGYNHTMYHLIVKQNIIDELDKLKLGEIMNIKPTHFIFNEVSNYVKSLRRFYDIIEQDIYQLSKGRVKLTVSHLFMMIIQNNKGLSKHLCIIILKNDNTIDVKKLNRMIW